MMTVTTPKPNGVTRDVQQELLKQHTEKRRRNGGVSPVQFEKSLTVGDDWNCVFLNHISSGVTMHPYEQPLNNVLDLGCGTGLWAIEVAKTWPHCNIVGFDILPIQPDLTLVKLGIEYRELSERVKWVHGDFLNPLPFETGRFDLVRICCIGLNVPEDRWQDLLEECARVLRPGGSIEVIEEDLLFPAGRTRKPDGERTSKSPSMLRASGERIRSDSTAKHSSQSNSLDSMMSSSSRSNADSQDALFAQDHPRLKEAWEEMLSQRFLTHKLLNVLPFYLSSFFSNVHVHPTMHVALPPPSAQRGTRRVIEHALQPGVQNENVAHWVEDMRSHAVRLSTSDGLQKGHSAALRASKPSNATVTLWSALHLARQVHLVSACKEAIWEAYCALTGAAREAFLHPDDAAKGPPREDLREEFEREWAAWESDMKDRIGMREHVQETIAWRDPDLISFRGSSSLRASSERPHIVDPQMQNPDWDVSEKASLCRSMRGFIAWKPAA
ncbi:S-adenosyl-L-methionine-dependent methyltransferase [Trametes maxima]|nr:S-adenosyl-L-methionine-dependent methyltransferase [Trametes maxima]